MEHYDLPTFGTTSPKTHVRSRSYTLTYCWYDLTKHTCFGTGIAGAPPPGTPGLPIGIVNPGPLSPPGSARTLARKPVPLAVVSL